MKQYIDRETAINELSKIPAYFSDGDVRYGVKVAIAELEKLPTAEEETCNCLKTSFKDEYWGYWLKCECGHSSPEYSNYCTGCGRKIKILGVKEFVFGLEDD